MYKVEKVKCISQSGLKFNRYKALTPNAHVVFNKCQFSSQPSSSLFDHHNFLTLYTSLFQRSWFPALQFTCQQLYFRFNFREQWKPLYEIEQIILFDQESLSLEVIFQMLSIGESPALYLLALINFHFRGRVFQPFTKFRGTPVGVLLSSLIRNESQKEVSTSSAEDQRQQKKQHRTPST